MGGGAWRSRSGGRGRPGAGAGPAVIPELRGCGARGAELSPRGSPTDALSDPRRGRRAAAGESRAQRRLIVVKVTDEVAPTPSPELGTAVFWAGLSGRGRVVPEPQARPYSGLWHPEVDDRNVGHGRGSCCSQEGGASFSLPGTGTRAKYPRGGRGFPAFPPNPFPEGGHLHSGRQIPIVQPCLWLPSCLGATRKGTSAQAGHCCPERPRWRGLRPESRTGLCRSPWQRGPQLGPESSRKWEPRSKGEGAQLGETTPQAQSCPRLSPGTTAGCQARLASA